MTNADDVIQQYKQRLARYERIMEISQQLSSTLDSASLLRKIIAAAIELTDTEAVSILLVDQATGELRFEQASNTMLVGQMQDIVVPLEGSIAGWVVMHGEGRVIEDVSQDPSFYKDVDDELEFTTRNLLAVPLRTHHKVIGVLEALNKRNNERFNDEDVRILNTLAVHAAIALENVRLFQQSDFMSEMVHELRNPLAAVKTSIILLMRPEINEEKRIETLGIMQGETERLIHLTSDYLDLARLESGRAHLNIEDFDLTQLVMESLRVVKSQAESSNLTIHYELGQFTLHADRSKIKQVLLNLLTNAIKYNHVGGEIYIRARYTTEYDTPFVQISVTDTGYGISKESQKNMFQKFYRVAETSDVAHGTGLGLAIAKIIVLAHGGHIWLESDIGTGSTFFITLPEAMI